MLTADFTCTVQESLGEANPELDAWGMILGGRSKFLLYRGSIYWTKNRDIEMQFN
jgi:hypothetical protein